MGLRLAATLAQSGSSDWRRVEHLSERDGRLLQTRDQEIQREFRTGWSVYSPLTALATAMSERQEPISPVAALDPFADSLDLLPRAGLIVARDHRVGLIHESLFDYPHPRTSVPERKTDRTRPVQGTCDTVRVDPGDL